MLDYLSGPMQRSTSRQQRPERAGPPASRAPSEPCGAACHRHQYRACVGRWWSRRGSRPTSLLISHTRRAWRRASLCLATGPPGSLERPVLRRCVPWGPAAARSVPAAPPDWSRADYDAYLRQSVVRIAPRRTTDRDPTAPCANPPLYYLVRRRRLSARPRRNARSGASTRFGSPASCSSLLTTAERVAACRRGVRASPPPAAGLRRGRGLLPMVTFMSTVGQSGCACSSPCGRSPLARRPRHQPSRPRRGRDCAGAATAAAILAKATVVRAGGTGGAGGLCGWLRRPRMSGVGAGASRSGPCSCAPVLGWVALAPSLGGTSITTVPTSAAHPFSVRQFLSYLWQFYLPRLPFLSRFRTTIGPPRLSDLAAAGSRDVRVARRDSPALDVPLRGVARRRDRGRIDRPRRAPA